MDEEQNESELNIDEELELIEDDYRPSSLRYFIIFLLVLIILGGVGYYFYNKNWASNAPDKILQEEKKEAEEEETAYTKEDAKSVESYIGGFTLYYPKTWFSDEEIKLEDRKEDTGYKSIYHFYTDNREIIPDYQRTYFEVLIVQNPDRTVEEEAEVMRNSKGLGTDKNLTYQGESAMKLITDDEIGGYYEEYVFQKKALRYFRQKDVMFLLSAHAYTKEEFEESRKEFDFILENITFDENIYVDKYTQPNLSPADGKRKSDLWELSDALYNYSSDRGEVPLQITYDGMIQILMKDGYLDGEIQDPSYPNKKYRYGSVCAENVANKSGTCFYRVDAVFDNQSSIMLKQDGGVDNTRYEVGDSIGKYNDKVKYMSGF